MFFVFAPYYILLTPYHPLQMTYDFSHLKHKAKEAGDWLSKEMSGIRTGRANPAVLDSVVVEAYGSRLSIKELAALSVQDSRTIRITPWDQSQTKAIEKAIISSSLGLSVVTDAEGLRAVFPELSDDRRQSLVRVAKEKLEQARVSLRGIRDEVWRDIQKKEKEGVFGEDEKFRLKKEMEKIVEESGKTLDDTLERKEKEIIS